MNTTDFIGIILFIIFALLVGIRIGSNSSNQEEITEQQYRNQSLQYLEDIRNLESEQRDALWCIYDGNCPLPTQSISY